MSNIDLPHDNSLFFYNIDQHLKFPSTYTISNSQTVDVAGFDTNNQPLLPDILPSQLLFTAHPPNQVPLHPLPPLLLEIDIDKCLPIPVIPLWFPSPLLPLPLHHLFHGWQHNLIGFIPIINSKQMPRIAFTTFKQFQKNDYKEWLHFQLWWKIPKLKTIFFSDIIIGLLTEVEIRLYGVHLA